MTDITLEQRLRDVIRDMDAHCDKLDAIGGGHAAQPIRNFAERIEAALRLSAGADARNAACKWWQQDEGYDTFSTSCGHEYTVNDCNDGNPNLPFCPYCAKRVEGHAWHPGDDAAPRHETGEGA